MELLDGTLLALHILRYMTPSQGWPWMSSDMGMQLASQVHSKIHRLPCPLRTCTLPWRRVQAKEQHRLNLAMVETSMHCPMA